MNEPCSCQHTYIPSVGNGHTIDRVWNPAGADDSIRTRAIPSLSARVSSARAYILCACGVEEREGLADVISIHDHLTNQILLSRSGKHRSQHACYVLRSSRSACCCRRVVGTRPARAHASLERQEAWTADSKPWLQQPRAALCSEICFTLGRRCRATCAFTLQLPTVHEY